jgi:hypothetical protein
LQVGSAATLPARTRWQRGKEEKRLGFLRLRRASPYQYNFREDELVGRDSVEPQRFAFSLRTLGVVAAAVLSGRIFRSVASDGGNYILGNREPFLPYGLVAAVAVAVAGGRTLGLGMGPDGIGGGVGVPCNFASKNLFRCCAS